jgi:hypothetical protein
MIIRFYSLSFLLSVSLLFFSCGESEKPGQVKKEEITVPESEFNACSFLDVEEVEKIFNEEFKEPKKGRSFYGATVGASFSECSYQSEAEGIGIYLSVYIRISPFEDNTFEAIQEVSKSFKTSGIPTKNIDGVGDVAIWGGNQLHVFIGTNGYIIVTLIGSGSQDAALDKAKQVAQRVAARMSSSV